MNYLLGMVKYLKYCSENVKKLLSTNKTINRSMPALTKNLFEREIEYTIMEYGNILNVYDTIDLYLAKK